MSRLRLALMASHTKAELREAAQVLGRAALQAGFRPGTGVPVAAARDAAAREAAAEPPADAAAGPFDFEADAARVPRAA
jgi:hypothetical protein